MKSLLITTLLALFILFMQACGPKPDPAKGNVIAKVGSQKIYAKDLENKLMSTSPPHDVKDKEKARKEQKKMALDSLINEAVVFQAAMDHGILDRSPRLRREIALEYVRHELKAKKKMPTDEELEAFFEEKKDDLEKIRVSHILIAPSENVSLEEARKTAEKVLSELKTDPKASKFAELAQKYSSDNKSKSRGGDLFLIKRSQKDPAFSEAAFALKNIGDISDIVQTKDGFHIIKLTGEQRGFKSFKNSLKWEYAKIKEREAKDQFFRDLRDQTSVKVYENAFNRVSAKN